MEKSETLENKKELIKLFKEQLIHITLLQVNGLVSKKS